MACKYFNALTRNQWTKWYIGFLVITVFWGLITVPLIWELTKPFNSHCCHTKFSWFDYFDNKKSKSFRILT